MKIKMEKALIFDMDGVIVNNDRFHCLAWVEFARNHNKEVTVDEVKSWFGNTNRTILENLFENRLSLQEINLMGQEKEVIYREMYKNDIKPVKGLKEFLASLNGSFRVGVATSAPSENVEFVLERTGLADFFSSITDASDIEKGKPEPEIFIKAAGKLGVPPEHCLVFEDSHHGIEAARRAGMHVVGVATTHKPEYLKGTDFIIHDFTEIDRDRINALFNH
jgi:beta-phosphoglucomutase